MKKVKDLPLNERPREKLLEKGALSLSDQELLVISAIYRQLRLPKNIVISFRHLH